MTAQMPCSLMFNVFKDFGRLNYRSLASIILTDRTLYDGRSPRSRIDEKTWLSRNVVHAPAGSIPEAYFEDFSKSAQSVAAHLKSTRGAGLSNEEIIGYFSGEGALRMAQTLEACHLDRTIYENIVNKVMRLQLPSSAGLVELLLIHFIATGCIGNPYRSAEYTLGYAQNTLGVQFRTSMATFAEVDGPDEEDDVQLCLFRMVGNKLKGKPYRLDPEGTEIGALSTSRSSINDVDPTVSGHHLRIWRGPGGHWYAEGLNSKNGTVLISGEDDSMRVVEPPRDKREGFASGAVPIAPGDQLVLGGATVFMVMQTV
ncbi:MAG: FHA domain-containing protein [Actinomycetota bacterium]|nr:FHA domain-containing protein [Actinomycetota bacterium]